jgi:hypothetical protein
MKTRPACPACGRAFRQGARVFVAIAGSLERRIVCRECASRGLTVVIPEATKSVREVLAPFAAHLHRLAKAYDGTERAEGLRQAADILAEGRAVPVDGKRAAVVSEVRSFIRRANAAADVVEPSPATSRKPTSPATTRSPALTKCERAILTALVQKDSPATRAELAIRSGYSSESGGFAKALASLRSAHYLDGGARSLTLTQAGASAAGPVEPLPRGAELLEYWCGRVGACGAAILQTLSLVYPNELARDELAERTGYSAQSGGFAKALAHLRTLELIDGTSLSTALAGAAGLLEKGVA